MKSLPKEHLSWSSLTLWESSKKSWWKRYVLGEKMFETKHLKKGKEFAEAVENDESEDLIIDSMLPYLQKCDVMEARIEALFPNDFFPDLKLLGFKDTATGFEIFREYKTGSLPWDQKKVDLHGQLAFYGLIDSYNGAEKPAKCFLDWFEVIKKKDSKEVEFTGKFESFERKLKKSDLTNMEKRIKKALKEMAEYDYVETLEMEDDNLLARYSKLDRLEKKFKEEKEKIKDQVKQMIEAAACQEAESESGKFYEKGNPPKWIYSNVLQKKIDAVDVAKVNEQKNGVAKKIQTTSLTWQANKKK